MGIGGPSRVEETCPRCASARCAPVHQPNLQVLLHCQHCGHSWLVAGSPIRKARAAKNNDAIVPHFDDDLTEGLNIGLQRVRDIPGCLVLHLSGYIDAENSRGFQKRVTAAIEAGYVNLIFDIAKTRFVSSSEIGSYTAFLKAVKPRAGDIVLARMRPMVKRVYALLEVDRFFNIHKTLKDARAFFQTRSAPTPSREPRADAE